MTMPPAPRFRRLERVSVVNGGRHQVAVSGEIGTVVWLDYFETRNEAQRHWMYIVLLSDHGRYITLSESDLQSTGEFESETNFLGTAPEVSFDIDMKEDMPFVEGTYRLPEQFWRVMVFAKRGVPTLRWAHTSWPSDNPWRESTDGLVFHVPEETRLDREYVLAAMTRALSVREWTEVRGPDSIVLR